MTIPVGFAEVTLSYLGNAAPNGASIVFGTQNLGDQTPAAIIADVAAAYGVAGFAARLTDDIALVLIKVKLGPDETGASGEAVVNVPGTQVTTSMPPGVACLLKKGTSLGGRRGRGRMYFCGIPESQYDDGGLISGASQTAWNTAGAAFITDLTVRDSPMVLLHEPATDWVLVNGQPRRVPNGDPVPAPNIVTTLTCDAHAASQRRRQRR